MGSLKTDKKTLWIVNNGSNSFDFDFEPYAEPHSVPASSTAKIEFLEDEDYFLSVMFWGDGLQIWGCSLTANIVSIYTNDFLSSRWQRNVGLKRNNQSIDMFPFTLKNIDANSITIITTDGILAKITNKNTAYEFESQINPFDGNFCIICDEEKNFKVLIPNCTKLSV